MRAMIWLYTRRSGIRTIVWTDSLQTLCLLLALAGVLFTAISYGKLVRQFPEAGSAYTYAQKSISPHESQSWKRK